MNLLLEMARRRHGDAVLDPLTVNSVNHGGDAKARRLCVVDLEGLL